MRVLVTGATGFIGSQVARELLRRGHEVHATVRRGSDRSRLRGIKEPLTIHEGAMDEMPIEPDAVIGLAWITEPGRYLEAPENKDCLDGSRRLLSKFKGRAIFAGTCFEFDTQIGRLREDSPTLPTSLYARCKDELRQEIERRPDSAWLRFFYQYGPGEDPRRSVPSIIRSVIEGRDMKLSPGEQKRDYLHVEDVASAVCQVLESPLTGCVNIGSAEAPSLREMATTIGELAGKPEVLRFGELPYWKGEPMLIVADNTKLRSTGWNPRRSLREGLTETVAWWRRRLEEGD